MRVPSGLKDALKIAPSWPRREAADLVRPRRPCPGVAASGMTWARMAVLVASPRMKSTPLGPAEVKHLRRCIMAVRPNQDLHPESGGPDQTAQVEGYLPTAGAAGGAREDCNEPALAIEHDDGLEAIFVVMGVEQP